MVVAVVAVVVLVLVVVCECPEAKRVVGWDTEGRPRAAVLVMLAAAAAATAVGRVSRLLGGARR